MFMRKLVLTKLMALVWTYLWRVQFLSIRLSFIYTKNDIKFSYCAFVKVFHVVHFECPSSDNIVDESSITEDDVSIALDETNIDCVPNELSDLSISAASDFVNIQLQQNWSYPRTNGRRTDAPTPDRPTNKHQLISERMIENRYTDNLPTTY